MTAPSVVECMQSEEEPTGPGPINERQAHWARYRRSCCATAGLGEAVNVHELHVRAWVGDLIREGIAAGWLPPLRPVPRPDDPRPTPPPQPAPPTKRAA
jgi:hypothetical protein